MKRIIALMAVLAILCGTLAGCGKGKTAAKNDGGAVKLKWVMPGPGKQLDSEEVWKKFNEELGKVIPNLSVEFEIIPTADYKQKYMLMRTGREEMDITSTYTLDFYSEVKNESFMKLNDLIDKQAPELKKQLPEWLWSYSTVNDNIYSIPVYQSMQTQVQGIRTPKEYADKYLDAEKAKEVFWSSKTFTSAGYDVIEDYLKKLKDNGVLGLGFEPAIYPQQGYEQFLNPYAIKVEDKHPKVVNIWQTPEVKEYYAKVADWYKKGYIRKDILSVKDSTNDKGRKDGYTVWLDQTIKNSAEKDSNKYNMPIEVIPLQNYFYIPSTASAGGTAISSNCKHPNEAIKFMELMNTDKGKDLYRLLVFGIEGKHYKKISDDRAETIGYVGQAGSTAPYGMLKWIIGNTRLAFETQTEFEGWNDYVFHEINEEGVKSKLMGFTPDIDPIKAKYSQVLTVKGEYASLGSGAIENYEQTYKEYMNKLEIAGNREIIDELQKQIDEFLKNK